MDRYFHISYAYTADNGSFGFGSSQTQTKGGNYLNKDKFIKDQIADNANNPNFKILSIVILNIIEIDAKDLNDFLYKI